MNVENFGKEGAGGTDVRAVDLKAAIDSKLGAANKTKEKKELRNVGPSITYRLRDAAGQASEFHNYMLPVDMDGSQVFLLGMRTNMNDRFSYLRVPADEKGSIESFVVLNAALRDPELRKAAVARYVKQAIPADKPQLAAALESSASRALDLFAGAGDAKTRGLQALGDFMEKSVPEAERAKASDVLVRILNGVLFELAQISRAKAGLPVMPANEKVQAFMTSAVLALSEVHLYPAPMAFMLSDFQQVQASVFQVARAPGKNIVYLGCVLLILGVFAMLYIRERRLWVWLAEPNGANPTQTAGDAKVQATMALSSNRQMMDTDKEFAKLKQQLLGA
jgi:cytochrome c biogenesis protein